MTAPLVSVVLRTRDRPWYLRQALAGLADQTWRDFEVLVVNDGGSDVSPLLQAFAEGVPHRYLPLQPGRGRSAAANAGLAAARGRYVAYLDDDDLYYPEHLETLVRTLEDRGAAVAYTNAYEVRHTRAPAGDGYVEVGRALKLDYDFSRARFFLHSYIHLVTIMHRRELVDQVGGFDESLPVLEDLDFFFRLAQVHDFVHIRRITAEYRIRDDGTNAVTALSGEFVRTRERIYAKYMHMILPEIIKYTEHKDRIVQGLLDRVTVLEERLRRLEEERRR